MKEKKFVPSPSPLCLPVMNDSWIIRPQTKVNWFLILYILTHFIIFAFVDLNVRLVGASVANVGRVEVFYAGVWGTINSYNWDIHDVHVVCRQLGYPGAISSGYSNQFGFGTGPLWFYNVRCLGNESNFGQCAKDIFGYLNHYGSYVSTASCKLPYQSGENERSYLLIYLSWNYFFDVGLKSFL